jgi:pimeloyl-ACP methyl ester carboxylesterase
MRRSIIFAMLFASALLSLAACRKNATWSDPSPHRSAFAIANGVRLKCVDWGGSTLILVDGFRDKPHPYDDFAPALTDHFRVLAYARPGEGDSEAKEPYDIGTLAEDLRGLMDGLGVGKAHLAGFSMGGGEITAMAIMHPERVDRLVYLDSAYGLTDPTVVAEYQKAPEVFLRPTTTDPHSTYSVNL